MTDTRTRPVALVTGASRGLGFLLARELADRGHDLVISARNEQGLDVAAADLRGHGAAVVTVAGDVARPPDVARMVAAARERFGRLDVLAANAGIIQVGPAAAMRESDFTTAVGSILWGVINPVLAAWPLLRETSGRVLVITSLGGKLPAPHLLPYVTAKHGAVGFAEGLRVEAARDGISVTVAVPGLMRTGSPRNALFTGDRGKEYRWFAVGDSLPGMSMDAERAAATLVRATLRGKPEVVLTVAAKVATRVHGLAPATMLRATALINRLLPDGSRTPVAPGHAVAAPGRVFQALTALTTSAARRFHQYDDPTPTDPQA